MNVGWRKRESDMCNQYAEGHIFEDNEHDLIVAAIREALKDYRNAYKRKDYSRCDAIEMWFHSPIFDLWTLGNINPDSLLREVRKQVDAGKNKMYQHKRIQEKRFEINDN